LRITQTELRIGGGVNVLASHPEMIIAIDDRMDRAFRTILSSKKRMNWLSKTAECIKDGNEIVLCLSTRQASPFQPRGKWIKQNVMKFCK